MPFAGYCSTQLQLVHVYGFLLVDLSVHKYTTERAECNFILLTEKKTIVGQALVCTYVTSCNFYTEYKNTCMDRHKCQVVACMSSHMQCELMNCYVVYWQINLI